MNNKQRLEEFFRLENSREWEKYEAFLDPEVEWTLYSSDEWFILRGRDAYMEKMLSAYRSGNLSFFCKEMLISADGNRLITSLENSDGNISTDIFDFKDGLIIREWEYLMT